MRRVVSRGTFLRSRSDAFTVEASSAAAPQTTYEASQMQSSHARGVLLPNAR